MSARRAAWAAWAAWFFALACGGGHPAPPAVVGWFVVQVAAIPPSEGGSAAACPSAPQQFRAWSGEDPDVTMACRVRPDGSAFDVDVTASTASATLTLSGTMSLTKSDVSVTLSLGSTTLASSGPCTIDFTGQTGQRPGSVAVGGGEVDAIALCPTMADGHGHTCYVSTEFSFSNCAR